jgi:hypothetical protein
MPSPTPHVPLRMERRAIRANSSGFGLGLPRDARYSRSPVTPTGWLFSAPQSVTQYFPQENRQLPRKSEAIGSTHAVNLQSETGRAAPRRAATQLNQGMQRTRKAVKLISHCWSRVLYIP